MSGQDLGHIHLIKYAYLADLKYAETHWGTTYTGVPWRFYHFGPWAIEVHDRVEFAAAAIGAERRTFTSARYEGEFVRFRLGNETLAEELRNDIPWEVASAIRWALKEHGGDTASLLRDVYLTPPMLRAAPGELLTFEPSFENVVTRDAVSGVAARAEPLADEDLRTVLFLGDEPVGPSEFAKPYSLKKRKERDETLRKLRQDVRRRLEERTTRRVAPTTPPPRYDAVFLAGENWLDQLAGTPARPIQGEAVFSDDIWKSPGRGDPDVP